MTPDQLEATLLRNRASAHRLTCASGETLVVSDVMNTVVIERDGVRVFDPIGPGRRIARSSRLVRVDETVGVEVIASTGRWEMT